MQRHANHTASGTTLIELIMVLVVISVLSGAVMVKLSAVTQRSVGDQADLLRRNLGHIQSIGLTYGVALRLSVSSTGYDVKCLAAGPQCSAAGAVVTDPSTGQPYAVALPAGVTLSAIDGANAGAATTDFDSAGRPVAGAVPIATNPARTFTLATASSGNDPVKRASVILRPITGFVEVSY